VSFTAKLQRGREVLEQRRRLSVQALGCELGVVENVASVKRSGGEGFNASPSRGRR